MIERGQLLTCNDRATIVNQSASEQVPCKNKTMTTSAAYNSKAQNSINDVIMQSVSCKAVCTCHTMWFQHLNL